MLTPDELMEYKRHLARCEEGGNDGPDVYEAEEFCKAMVVKYLKPFHELLPYPVWPDDPP